MDEVYRERNALVAFLASKYDGVLVEDSDDFPGWGVVFIETRFGQMSWHIPPEDFDLFTHVDRVDSYVWDGHTTEEKYQRLERLAEYVYM